ncbi:MAG: Dabb family protein [Planctomycetota bacterium]|jgi:hypothetical protein|nr:Dabb family protein [Planctomycetota bacterium]
MITHTVFFTLQDSSSESVQALIAAARTHLAPHDGIRHFSAAPRALGLDRPVTDTEFHVALCIAFESRAAHDLYQETPAHQSFIDECQANWAEVRVFDSEG